MGCASRIIDAFTERAFRGNPAAVCLLDTATWPDEGWMQQVAAEMNLSETAFAHPLSNYWSARLGRASLVGLQASARTGLVRTAVHGDHRVHLTGQAVTVLDGTLHHTPR